MNNDATRLLKTADALAEASKTDIERLDLKLIHYGNESSEYHCDVWFSDGRQAFIYVNGTVEWRTWKE